MLQKSTLETNINISITIIDMKNLVDRDPDQNIIYPRIHKIIIIELTIRKCHGGSLIIDVKLMTMRTVRYYKRPIPLQMRICLKLK